MSRKWGGDLVPFFEEHGYTYAAGPYGNPFNGYMGVCVAWPRAKYAADEVLVQRVTDSVEWVKEPDWTCPGCKVCGQRETVAPALCAQRGAPGRAVTHHHCPPPIYPHSNRCPRPTALPPRRVASSAALPSLAGKWWRRLPPR